MSFKQTEIGRIPNDWELYELKDKVKKQSSQPKLELPKQVTPVLYDYDQSSSEPDTYSSSSSSKESSSSSTS